MADDIRGCRVLIIEDNPNLAELLNERLTEVGLETQYARTGEAGTEMLAQSHPDIILLDVMLPDQDGMDLCRQLRQEGVSAPILLLTALTETSDKISGLNAGADDYLPKPFEFDELLARMRSLIRRRRSAEPTVLKYHDIAMDLTRRTVSRQQKRIQMTTKEFELLEYFMRNPDRVLSRSAIAERVWNLELDSDSNVIDVYISTLRRKLDKPFDKTLIHTVVGTGYILSVAGPPA